MVTVLVVSGIGKVRQVEGKARGAVLVGRGAVVQEGWWVCQGSCEGA